MGILKLCFSPQMGIPTQNEIPAPRESSSSSKPAAPEAAHTPVSKPLPPPPTAHDEIFENLFGAPLKADAAKKPHKKVFQLYGFLIFYLLVLDYLSLTSGYFQDKPGPGRPKSSKSQGSSSSSTQPAPPSHQESKESTTSSISKDKPEAKPTSSISSSSSSSSSKHRRESRDSSKRPPEEAPAKEHSSKKRKKDKERERSVDSSRSKSSEHSKISSSSRRSKHHSSSRKHSHRESSSKSKYESKESSKPAKPEAPKKSSTITSSSKSQVPIMDLTKDEPLVLPSKASSAGKVKPKPAAKSPRTAASEPKPPSKPAQPKNTAQTCEDVFSTGELSDSDPFEDGPPVILERPKDAPNPLGKMLEGLESSSEEEREIEEDRFPSGASVPWSPHSVPPLKGGHRSQPTLSDDEDSSSSSSSSSFSSSSCSEDEDEVPSETPKGQPSKPEETPIPKLVEKTEEAVPAETIKAPNGETFRTLLELQSQLQRARERGFLLRVMSIIQETGLYKIQDNSFDFDLCSLDAGTVHRIKEYMDTVKTWDCDLHTLNCCSSACSYDAMQPIFCV